MKNWIIGLVFKWVFIDGLKEIEKQNYITKFLEKMYQQPDLKKNWKTVCQGIAELLRDAMEETKVAGTWTHSS